ncbi:MAG: hypothetical protein ACYDG2_15385 [Ruminiclostridium sp.]
MINCIKDSSIGDGKRLRAHLFIGDISSKCQIIRIIKSVISWLKTVENVPSPTMYHKSGEDKYNQLSEINNLNGKDL